MQTNKNLGPSTNASLELEDTHGVGCMGMGSLYQKLPRNPSTRYEEHFQSSPSGTPMPEEGRNATLKLR